MCDFTLAVPEAKFGYTEVRIGFVPAIVSSILVWQVGQKIARDLLLTGRLFDAAEAHRFGLVNEVVASDNSWRGRGNSPGQIMENSPTSVRMTKKLINSFLSRQLDEQIRGGGRRECAHPHDRRFSRGRFVVPGKAQTALERASERGPRVCERRVRVRYAETDQMGVVYHANHFIWFEVGRVEFMRQLGFTYRDMEREHGFFIAVVDARCRYKAPAQV